MYTYCAVRIGISLPICEYGIAFSCIYRAIQVVVYSDLDVIGITRLSSASGQWGGQMHDVVGTAAMIWLCRYARDRAAYLYAVCRACSALIDDLPNLLVDR